MRKAITIKVCLMVALAATGLGPAVAQAAGEHPKLSRSWEAQGFSRPESVLYDAKRDVLYVSNVNGGPGDKDGNGFISKVAMTGVVIQLQWVTGLNGPKGMAISEDRLFVSDIDRIVKIVLETGAIEQTYEVPGAKFLNDVAADEHGHVYVSDMRDNAIYRVCKCKKNEVILWLQDPGIGSPNGLYVDGPDLVVAESTMTEASGQEQPGHLVKVNLATKAIQNLGDGSPLGSLDGLEAFGSGKYLVTDWKAGKLFLVEPSGQAGVLLELNPGTADLEYIAGKKLVLIPLMNDGKITAYQVE